MPIKRSDRGRISCSLCGKFFGWLEVISETKETMCTECFEKKGGRDYVIAFKELDAKI